MRASVRRVRASEWPALRALRLRALAEDPLAFYRSFGEEEPLPEEHWRRWARDGEAGATTATFVADAEGALVGLASVYPDEGRPQLVAMWVAPEARGAGVGRLLVEACAGWTRERGHAQLSLWVNEDNPAAFALYRRCGFAPTGREEPQRWQPARRVLEMALPLRGGLASQRRESTAGAFPAADDGKA